MRKTILNRSLLLILLICMIAVVYRLYQRSDKAPPAEPSKHNARVIGKHNEGIPKIGGPFSLIDTRSHTFTEKNLLGKYTVMYFGYTFCPDIFPQALVNISDGVNMLPTKLREKMQVVFVTVDPKRDTPDILAKYLKIYPTAIIGLTGTTEQVAKAKRTYRVFSRTTTDNKSTDYAIDHSSVVYVMGPDGNFVTHFNHQTESTEVHKALLAAVKTQESLPQ